MTTVRRIVADAEEYAAALAGSFGCVLMIGPETDYSAADVLVKLGAIVATDKRLVIVVHGVERLPNKVRKIADAVIRANDAQHANSAEIRAKVEAAMDRFAGADAPGRTEVYRAKA